MSGVDPIFLYSLPRSGSSLLQRMLASHSAISTAPEPWLLLPLLYALRPSGVYAEYGHATSVQAIEDLCERLPHGRRSWLEAVRALATSVYQQASAPGSRYFVDKTPRYNLVAGDVLELFPDARHVILWRNPLAVLASILDSWVEGRWMPYLHKVDLYVGLERLLRTYSDSPSSFVTLRYEDLVANPRAEAGRILDHLRLEWEDTVTGDVGRRDLVGRVGDTTGVLAYRTVSTASLHKWKATLASPIRKRWSRRYLHWLGAARLRMMGYNLQELLAELDDAPVRASTVASDVALGAKGVLWSLAEPRILEHKRALLPRWHHIHSHD